VTHRAEIAPLPSSPTFLAVLAELQTAGRTATEHTSPADLLLALQDLIIAVVTTEPKDFDRPRYDRLFALRKTLQAELPSAS
jgi:hypothetical protein